MTVGLTSLGGRVGDVCLGVRQFQLQLGIVFKEKCSLYGGAMQCCWCG
jgi:hypothetical protein